MPKSDDTILCMKVFVNFLDPLTLDKKNCNFWNGKVGFNNAKKYIFFIKIRQNPIIPTKYGNFKSTIQPFELIICKKTHVRCLKISFKSMMLQRKI